MVDIESQQQVHAYLLFTLSTSVLYILGKNEGIKGSAKKFMLTRHV